MGRHQRTFALVVMLFGYQLPFLLTLALFFYSLIEWDLRIWVLFLGITIAQYPVTKCEPYINFVNNYINPLLYFKSFRRIFEEPIAQDKEKCMFAFHPHSVFAYGMGQVIFQGYWQT